MSKLTNGHLVFEKLSSHGDWVWVLPVERINDDLPLIDVSPLTFRIGDLDEWSDQ